MSDYHRELGHFPNPIKKALRRIYSLCPVCGRPAEHFDHLFPLQWAGVIGEAFGFTDSNIHDESNGWRLCAFCHHEKSVEENRASQRADGSISAVYNRWYAKAYDKKGRRKFWKGPVTDKKSRNQALKKKTAYYRVRQLRIDSTRFQNQNQQSQESLTIDQVTLVVNNMKG